MIKQILLFVLVAGVIFLGLNAEQFLKIKVDRKLSAFMAVAIAFVVLALNKLSESFDDRIIGYDDPIKVESNPENVVIVREVKSIPIPNQSVNVNPSELNSDRTWLGDESVFPEKTEPEGVNINPPEMNSDRTWLGDESVFPEKTEPESANINPAEMNSDRTWLGDDSVFPEKTEQERININEGFEKKKSKILTEGFEYGLPSSTFSDLDQTSKFYPDQVECFEETQTPNTLENYNNEIKENKDMNSGCAKCGVPMEYTTWQEFWKAGCM